MAKSTIDQEVELLGKDLEVDGTLSTSDCPMCHGGKHKDKAFTITRLNEGLIYNCFRASCECSGFVPTQYKFPVVIDKTNPVTVDVPKGGEKKKFRPKYYEQRTIILTAEQKEWFGIQFGLTLKEIADMRITYNATRTSYAFPILNWRGFKLGTVDRAYWNRTPKAITYMEIDEPVLHFPYRFNITGKGPIFLVEDQISAQKVMRYANSAALLGSHLSPRAAQLLTGLTDHIVFALDADATERAIMLKRKYDFLFKEVSVVKLDCDPKDMDDERLKGIFSGWTE